MKNRQELLEEARLTSERESESDNFKRLGRSERETHYLTTDEDNEWFAESSIPKDIHRLEKNNWILVDTIYYPDGTVMRKRFKAPRNYLAPRSIPTEDKPKRVHAPISEELKAKMAEGRMKKKLDNNI